MTAVPLSQKIDAIGARGEPKPGADVEIERACDLRRDACGPAPPRSGSVAANQRAKRWKCGRQNASTTGEPSSLAKCALAIPISVGFDVLRQAIRIGAGEIVQHA